MIARIRTITPLLITFIIGAVFSSVVAIAWTGPTQTPPSANVAAPVNVGTTEQIKNGTLGVNALAVFGNAIISTVSGYLNFGDITGSSGYGIRDNAGVMEFKNTAGSWASLTTIIQNYFASSSSNTIEEINFTDGTTQTTAASGGGITSCPSGWTMIGDAGKSATFCIETNERGAAQWPVAITTCEGINDATIGRAHLCEYREWHTACTYGTGISNMTDNSEWIADMAESGRSGFVGRRGEDCSPTGSVLQTSALAFRCCLQ